MYVRWTGWGIIALPVFMIGFIGGLLAAFLCMGVPTVGGMNGVPLLGIAVGLIVTGGVNYLLGMALNRRRRPDGTWMWTDRHTIYDLPIEVSGRAQAIGGVLGLPLATVGFVPAPMVWILLLGWAAAVIPTLMAIRKRRRAREAAEAASRVSRVLRREDLSPEAADFVREAERQFKGFDVLFGMKDQPKTKS